MTQTATPRFTTGSHSISIEWDGGVLVVSKEEVFFYFETAWRGTPARVTISADRYRHSSGMSEWRLYASEAREIDPSDPDNRWTGAHLTDLARRRLGESCIPQASNWLAGGNTRYDNGVSYRTSRENAFGYALTRMASDLSSRHDSTATLRRALATFRDELSNETRSRLVRAADAYDTFTAILNDAD